MGNDSIISRATILIICGFLMGLACATSVSPHLKQFVVLGAFAGLVAFMGLEITARKRQQKLEAAAEEQAALRLESQVVHQIAAGVQDK